MSKAVITIWNEQEDERSLFVEVEKYDGDAETSYYVGTLRLDHHEPQDCLDEEAKGLVGRTINLHLPNERHPEDRLNGVVEAALNHCMSDEQWLQDMAHDTDGAFQMPDTTDKVYQALESYICNHLARK